MMQKKQLSFWQILTMNFGFFGVQFSFGLQQSNMSAIYRYLGANEAELPMLWLAGPVTGLLVQPVIGAISDGTWSPKFGRRKPFFLIGALIASLALIAMPFSSSIWMAASLLWILDAANNIALEPYRAFVSDKLPKKQYSIGFLMQSFFTPLNIFYAPKLIHASMLATDYYPRLAPKRLSKLYTLWIMSCYVASIFVPRSSGLGCSLIMI